MNKIEFQFQMSEKAMRLLNKKELDLVRRSSLGSLRRYSLRTLQRNLDASRELRDKYRDLTQRQKAGHINTKSLNTIQKAKIFERLLALYRDQYEKAISAKEAKQQLLDRQEHYDIDGVTQRDGKLSFPLVIKNKKSLREISKRAGL